MKFRRKESAGAELDMTPMIDMTFQLVAFLMIMCNFSESEVDARVILPESVLAKPPEGAPDAFFTLQMTEKGECIVEGRLVPISGLYQILLRKAQYYEAKGDLLSKVTVIIRAHKEVATGKVQDAVKECQRARFETFVMRAKERI